jgi:GNAT superfamily N-acetyltransferase
MILRKAVPGDLVFVASSWLRSYATSDTARLVTPHDVWARGEASAEYWNGQRALIAWLLEQGMATVLVADDEGMLQGWACASGHVLHYVYVRQSARMQGLARQLVTALGIAKNPEVRYTHRSRGVEQKRLPPRWRFDPYALFAAMQDAA